MGKNVIISEGNRPWWQLIVAAIHYTAMVYLLFLFFSTIKLSGKTNDLKGSLAIIQMFILLIPSALAFSVVRNFLFDLEQKKYKIEYGVGPLHVGKWKDLLDIEYVSVFKQPLAEGNFVYEANLWYKKNKHFNVYRSDTKYPAFEMGIQISKILKVRLLDATVPNKNNWVNLD
jgi:hypothetical protein